MSWFDSQKWKNTFRKNLWFTEELREPPHRHRQHCLAGRNWEGEKLRESLLSPHLLSSAHGHIHLLGSGASRYWTYTAGKGLCHGSVRKAPAKATCMNQAIIHFPFEVERSLIWAKVHRNPRSPQAITSGLYWKGLNPSWVWKMGEWDEMGSSWGHLASSTRPPFPQWKDSLNLICTALFTLLASPWGFHPHRAGGERNWKGFCWKLQSCKAQSSSQFEENTVSLSQKKIAALQCLHGRLGKVWRAANQQKALDQFEQVLDGSLNLVLMTDSVFQLPFPHFREADSALITIRPWACWAIWVTHQEEIKGLKFGCSLHLSAEAHGLLLPAFTSALVACLSLWLPCPISL